jgi:hypothetical protein
MSITDGLKPTYIPTGYKYFGIAEGGPAGEFNDDDTQVVVRYRTGTDYSQANMLSICLSPACAELNCVENVQPEISTLNGLSVRYYNGQWAPGPGDGRRDTPVGPVHWDRFSQHSISISVPGAGTIGVRCSPTAVPAVDELKRVAASLPILN